MFVTQKEAIGYARDDITPEEAQAAYNRFLGELMAASIRYLSQTGVNPAQAAEIVLHAAAATASGVKAIRRGLAHTPEIAAMLPEGRDWGANFDGFVSRLKKFTAEILMQRAAASPNALSKLLAAIKGGLAIPTGEVMDSPQGVQKHLNELGPGNIAVNQRTGEVVVAEGTEDHDCDNPDCPVHGENGLLAMLRKASGGKDVQVISLEDFQKPDDPLKIN